MFGKMFAKILFKLLDKFMTKFFGEGWYERFMQQLEDMQAEGKMPGLGAPQGGGRRPTSEEIKEQLDMAKKSFPRMYRWANKLCEKFGKKSLEEMTHQACGVEYPENLKHDAEHADTQDFEPGTEPANEQQAEAMVNAAVKGDNDHEAMAAMGAAQRAAALPQPKPGHHKAKDMKEEIVTRTVRVPAVVRDDCDRAGLDRNNDNHQRLAMK